MDANFIYQITCATLQYDMKMRIRYKDKTFVTIRPRLYGAVKNPRYNNGICVLHSNIITNPTRFVFHHEAIEKITIS